MPELESFRYGRKTIKLVKVVGEVRSIEKRELTHVHSTGGGGRISGGHGYIDAPRVYSSTTTQHDFWLRLDDDTEKHFSFDTATPLPIREGDSVVMVYIEGAAAPMLFHNKTAGAKRILTNGYRLNEAWRFERGPFDFSARSDGSRPPAERALARGSLCALTQVLVRQ